ncbi:hypothetical protein [Luteimonas cucumeris]|uniref:hypothetical protein n=1 Tax=Luteimonas cucumeris TaxID=985012 RepID=UPI0011A96F52|nr:hypothetical protein [Luteimonas cucumeris]
MAAALRVYGVTWIAGSSCQGQQPTANSQQPTAKSRSKVEAIGRLLKTTKRCNQISSENKKLANNESRSGLAPIEYDVCQAGFGPFLWLLSLGQQRK